MWTRGTTRAVASRAVVSSSWTRARGRRASVRAVRDPRRDDSRVDGDAVDDDDAVDDAIARSEGEKRTRDSVEVQRRLARRLLDAQRRWVGPASSSGRDGGAARVEDGLVDDAEVVGVIPEAYTRVRWLLGLLFLQSTSSVVLSRYENLIKENIVITLFLTMLVGAGGNAGNQSAIHVIRGLATGEMENTSECLRKTLAEQFQVGLLLATALSTAGFARVLLTSPEGTNDLVGPFAISTALFAIVTVSTCIGTVLPFLLMRFKQDPANAGTSVQVIMDVSGVVITCTVGSFIFEHASEWSVFAHSM
jgi:cation transporter-like permease